MYILLLLFTISLFIQIGFILLINTAVRRYKPVKSNESPSISVIIAARNEESNIGALLEDLKAQTYSNFEVIVVDNNSSDNTVDLVKTHDFVNIVPSGEAPEGYNNKKWAISKGVEAASFEHLLFTDADVRVQSDWVASMAAGFSNGGSIVLGVSPYKKLKGGLNRFIRYESLFTAFQYIGFSLMGWTYMGIGRNMGYRKEVWYSVNGFEGIEGVKGGDDDLLINRTAAKFKTAIVLGNESLVESFPKESYSDFFKQKIRHLSVGNLYRSKDKLMLGLFLVSLFLLTGTGVVLILSGLEPFLILGGLAARYAFFVPAFIDINRKMGVRFEWPYIVPLDILYPVYYISAAIGTLWAKKIQWK